MVRENMSTKKVKIEKTLEAKQIAAFLRLMAAEIEGGGEDSLNGLGVDLHSFNKLKLALIKKEGGDLVLTLKVKQGRQLTRQDKEENAMPFKDIAEMKYRPLKKTLKSGYAAIRKEIEGGGLPSEAEIKDFMALTRTMVSYPGFGDDSYADFSAACQELDLAFKKRDFPAFRISFQKIGALRKSCHGRYK